MTEGEAKKDCKAAAPEGAESAGDKQGETDKGQESLNSVCELKDSPLQAVKPELRQVANAELVARLSQSKNVSLGENQCVRPKAEQVQSFAPGKGKVASDKQCIAADKSASFVPGKLDGTQNAEDIALTRAAGKAVKAIEALLPPLPERPVYAPVSTVGPSLMDIETGSLNDPPPVEKLSKEDEKKLRALISTASEADLNEMNKLSKQDLLKRFQNDERISPATKAALEILFNFPKEKRTDEELGRIAKIALDNKNLELFKETMAETGRSKRSEITEEQLLKAFPGKDSKEFKLAKQYAELGRENPLEQIKANLGKLMDNRDAVKLALSKLKPEDLEMFRRGKSLDDGARVVNTDLGKMTKEERELYELGERLAKGKVINGITPAQEKKALDQYRDVEAAAMYRSVKDKDYWSPTTIPELNALANYPEGKLASNLADMRGFWAPAVRDVAKVIRETLGEKTATKEAQFYKDNPDRIEDINKVLDQLRLSPNDAMALKRYLRFFTEGSLSVAEKALYRQPVIEAIKEKESYLFKRDTDFVVSAIQNMTPEEIERYRNPKTEADRKFRQDLRNIVASDSWKWVSQTIDAEHIKAAQDSKDRLFQSEIGLRLLDKIDKGEKPEPDIVTKLQLNFWETSKISHAERLKMVVEALSDPKLREKLQSTETQDQEFINAFHKSARLALYSARLNPFADHNAEYNNIVVPMIKTGVPPLKAMIEAGTGYFALDAKVFEDIAGSSKETRDALVSDGAKSVLPDWGNELQELAVRVAKDGKFTDADRVWLGLNSRFSGGDLIVKTLEKVSGEQEGAAKFKADFAKANPGVDLEAALKEKLSPIEFARAKFVLAENLSEREKYLETLDLMHSAIKGWGSEWTELFGSATRGQTIAAMDEYTAEVAKAAREMNAALADEKVRQAVWKAVENHLTTRSELMMYGGDAAGMGTPLAGGAFVAYVLGAKVTVPVTAVLLMGGVLSRMGVRQGALGDFYDTRTKNLIIDTITSTILSATTFLGPTQIAKLLKYGETAGAAAAREVPTILAAVDSQASKHLVPGATDILIADSQEIVKRAMLGASRTFDEKMIKATAEKVLAAEGFASPAQRAAAVNHMAYAIKTSLQQKYNIAEMSALLRYGKAGGADIGAGFLGGGTASSADDLLHGKELGFHNLMAAMQAALFAGTLGLTFRGLGQYRANRANMEKSVEGKKISENVHEYQPANSAQQAANEVKAIPAENAIEIRPKQGEAAVRRFEFNSNPKAGETLTPKKIVVGQGADKFEMIADAQDARLWHIIREGQPPQKLQAEISVDTRTGSYTVNHVTDSSANWYARAYADGMPASALTRKVTYHADGRVTYEGPSQNNFYPVEGSVFWKEARQGEFWQAPDGGKTWITGDNRIFRETFGGVWQADDGVFVDGSKEVLKIREVKAEKLDEDLRWIDENDIKYVDRSNPNKPVLKSDAPLAELKTKEAGQYYKIHTGRNDFFVLKDGKLEPVDYYLAPAAKFEKSYRASGREGHFVKTESMTVRQLKKGESRQFDKDTAKQDFAEGDYVVLENGKEVRGIKKAEYDKLLFIDQPNRAISGRLDLPPTEGTTSYDAATGIARSKWAKRDAEGKVINTNGVPEEGYIIWRNKEGTIEVVGGSEPRMYQVADAEAKGYRFYWADGSAEYVNPQGMRFTKKPGEEAWLGDDGARLIEADKGSIRTLSTYDPVEKLSADNFNSTRPTGLGLKDEGRFLPVKNKDAQGTASDGTPRQKQYFAETETLVVNEGNVQFVQTPEGRFRIEAGQPTWFLDKHNMLWSTSAPVSVSNGKMQFPGKIEFSNLEGHTYTRNVHGQFWDFGKFGSKWVDTSGKYWYREPGDVIAGTPKSTARTWTGEDGSLYTEGSWEFTPHSKHDPRRLVQGVSAVGAIGAISRPAGADELGHERLDPATEALLAKLSPKELQELALPGNLLSSDSLLRRLIRSAGSEVVRSAKQGLYFTSGAVPAVIAQDQLKQLIYEAKQRAASHLRPETPELSSARKDAVTEPPAEKTIIEPLPEAKLTDADLVKRLAALSDYPRLKGEERARAGFLQQSLMENMELYHSVDLKTLQGKTEAELKANYETLMRQSRLELQRSLKIEQTIGVFGPASRAAYNEFMKWSQTQAGPSLRKQIQEWQVKAPAGQARSLIDEASGKAMSPELYMAKLLAGELKEEGQLKPDVKSVSEADIAKFESAFNGLVEMQRLVAYTQLQNKEFAMSKLIGNLGLPKEWLRKESEALPAYLERVEKFVQLSAAVTSTIDRTFDLWKRSENPDFAFSLPPGAAIRLKGSPIKITSENLSDPEIQKLLKKGQLERIDPGIKGDLRWDHPPGSMQRTIDWVLTAKQRTDKMEPVLDEIRKNPEKILMYQDKPIVGQAVKLDENGRFAGLVSPDSKPEKAGEIITSAAGLISHDYTSEKIKSGPNAGMIRVVQTLQAYTTPPLAYLDTRALGMEAVGEATVVSEKFYKPDDLVPVMHGNNVTYIKASQLENHKLQEQLHYWGHKVMTGAFDATIGASVAVTTTGVRAMRAMSAAELALASKTAAVESVKWTGTDSAKQFAMIFARGAAVATAPLNSTGGMAFRYNDMPVGEWINHGRGLFYLGEMSFGLAKGGFAGYQKWHLGKEAFEAKEAARFAAGKASSTEKLHKGIKDDLPELMVALNQIDRANKWLQLPLAASLGSEFYGKYEGKKGDSLAAAADASERKAFATFEKIALESLPKSKLAILPKDNQTFKESAAYLLNSIKESGDAARYENANKLVDSLDIALRKPPDKAAIEKIKAELFSKLAFSPSEWSELERAHPDYRKAEYRLDAKDITNLLDPQKRLEYPKAVQELAEKFLKAKDKEVTALSRMALLELSRQTGESLEFGVELPAYQKTVQLSPPEVPRATVKPIEIPARSETVKLGVELISKQLLYDSLQKPQTAEGLLAAHELYANGRISAAQLGALYQDVLDNPRSSLAAKEQALAGVGGAGLAWMIESMRSPKDPESAKKFSQLRMGEKDFLAALERFANTPEQPPDLRALAAAQIHALRLSQDEKSTPTSLAKSIVESADESQNLRAKALADVYTEFKTLTLDSQNGEYSKALKERLGKEILGSAVAAKDDEKSRQLIAAQSLLLLSKGSDAASEKAALRAIVNSFSINNPDLSRQVMLAMTPENLKRFDEIDKGGADLLRLHALSLLSAQARGKEETLAVATLEEVNRLFGDSTNDMKAQLKTRLLGLIDKGSLESENKDYIGKMPVLRARVIDTLANLGAPDVIDKIREHAGANSIFVKDGQTYRFVESNAQVRLSALNALEKLNGKLEKSARLENYLPVLLRRETDPTVSAAMLITANRLGVQSESSLEGSIERTLAVLMMQSVNDKDSGSRGWTNDLELTKTWLSTNFDMLSSDGLARTASANAKGFVGRMLNGTETIKSAESKVLLETMERQFNELVELAGGNEERANLAKRALHAIMTRQIHIPGTKENPITVAGSYPLQLKEGQNWAKKAAEGLAKIASQPTSSKDLTAMFLLDGLLEARDPQVAGEVITGLEAIAKEQPLKVQNFISHRLSEFFNVKERHEGASGELVAELLDFAFTLNNPKVVSNLESIRQTSPYIEVKAKADELIVQGLDPIAADLRNPIDQTMSKEQLMSRLDNAWNISSDARADALRNFEGQDLQAVSKQLLEGLQGPDARIQLLSAHLILGSELGADHELVRESIKQTVSLALLEPAADADQRQRDLVRAVRKRAEETLQKISDRLNPGDSLSVELDGGRKVQLSKEKSGLVVLDNKAQEQPGFVPAPALGTEQGVEGLRDWLYQRYNLLSADGIAKLAAANAGGVITRLRNDQRDLIKAELDAISRAVESQFNKLVEDAQRSGEIGSKAKQALYAIVTEKIPISGTQSNPVTVAGTYPIKLDSLKLPARASQALAEIAAKEKSNGEATALMLDSLLEARNPKVAETILSNGAQAGPDAGTSMGTGDGGVDSPALQLLMDPEKLKTLVSHRLSEYLDLKEMKDGVSGTFVARLLEIAVRLDDHSTIAKLATVRERSPYKEVRDKARELMISELDPVKAYLNLAVDKQPSGAEQREKLKQAIEKGPESTAIALRNLEGVDLRQNDPALMEFLSGNLESPDAKLKILAARAILSSASKLGHEHALARKAMQAMAALSVALAADSADQKVLDQGIATRKRAMETLKSIGSSLPEGGVLSLPAGQSTYEIRVQNKLLNLVENKGGEPVAYAFEDGRALRLQMYGDKIVVNRNGVEYMPAPLQGLWIEKRTGLVVQADALFINDMNLLSRAEGKTARK